MKSDLEKFNEFVDWFWELVFGTKRIQSEEPDFTNVSKGFTKDEVKAWKEYAKKPKRARTGKGKYKADDIMTDDINEAWVGGKAPKKKGKK